MGQLIDGKWHKMSIIRSDKKGGYDRIPRTFHDVIAKDHETFQPESNRYHLYVSYACPWATRALIYRTLKGLREHISVDIVHPHMEDYGWSFDKGFKGATGDTLYKKKYMYEIYQKADPKISTSVTVPVLWDKKTETIVNNESSEIIRIFNTAFNELTGNIADYYPLKFHKEIDKWNDYIYHNINNGVYRSGFAVTQKAYDEAVVNLFKALDKLDDHFKDHEYLVGEQLTEADLRLIPTLLRFDLVYYVHFKTNIRKIDEYEHLGEYVRRIYAIDAVRKNHNSEHIKQHYFYSHQQLNPYQIVPLGPQIDWM